MAALAQGPAAPLFDRDNKCYHECEAEEHGGKVLQTDRQKGGMDGRVEGLQKHGWCGWGRQQVLSERLLLSGLLSPLLTAANGAWQHGSSSISGV